MNKLDGKSMNIVNDNIEKLKEIFPEVFSEGKIIIPQEDKTTFSKSLFSFSPVTLCHNFN